MSPFESVLFTACLASVFLLANGIEDYEYDYENTIPVKREALGGNCFSNSDDPDGLDRSIQEILKDKSVRNCFVEIQAQENVKFDFNKLFSASAGSAGKEYDLFSGLFCPTWARSKQCLTDYLNSRCNSTDIEVIRNSHYLNVDIAVPSLMCEPIWENKLRYLFKSAKETGLLSCFLDEGVFGKEQWKCSVGSKSTYGKTGVLPPIRAYLQEFESCSTPLLHLCAEGDRAKTIEITKLFKDVMATIIENYDLFWENYLRSRN